MRAYSPSGAMMLGGDRGLLHTHMSVSACQSILVTMHEVSVFQTLPLFELQMLTACELISSFVDGSSKKKNFPLRVHIIFHQHRWLVQILSEQTLQTNYVDF